MPSKHPELWVASAGGVAFAGNMVKADGFPSNGYRILVATPLLMIVVAATKDTPLAPVVLALSALLLLTAILTYVPGFSKPRKAHNG